METTARAISLLAVAGALGLALAIVLQPPRAWLDAAEHSKQLWGAWVLGLVAAGLAAPLAAGVGWPTTAWLLVCCLVAAVQPSLLADLHDVREHAVRMRRPRTTPPPPPAPMYDDLPPISWRPPER